MTRHVLKIKVVYLLKVRKKVRLSMILSIKTGLVDFKL